MIEDQLENFATISLEEMSTVRLMNRVDTKYVTTLPLLIQVLTEAQTDYLVQQIDGVCNLPYYTLYFDTPAKAMYMEHLHGHKRRQKIRMRRYESSGIAFLEVKDKNNKGRTSKQRIPCRLLTDETCDAFIATHSHYRFRELEQQVENRFSRITLVNKAMTERVTIDSGLRFHNLQTHSCCDMKDLVVIELKRDGRQPSPLLRILRELRVHPSSFSKYCIGMSLTSPQLRHGRFKPLLHWLMKQSPIKIEHEGEALHIE